MSESKFDHLHKNKKEIFVNNLIGGLAWGIGATLGLSLLIAGLGIIANYLDLVPIVGNFVADVVSFILNKHPDLISINMPFIFSQYAYA